jgi:hypothetical protein
MTMGLDERAVRATQGGLCELKATSTGILPVNWHEEYVGDTAALGSTLRSELFWVIVDVLCRKYYDLEAFERAEVLKAAQERGSGGDKRAAAAFDARADEEALRRERIEQRRQAQQDRLNDAYNLLKHTDRWVLSAQERFAALCPVVLLLLHLNYTVHNQLNSMCPARAVGCIC